MSNNKPYQPWQYFFWMISGSEISVLKQCPTDYNRHAGIGFTILMTSLFGAFAGGYAGYYFTKSIGGSIGFGLLWGLLIFSIDRTMVVSLKKKPETKWHDHFWQILFRAVLAGLIAFIISIPLELLVFKSNIDAGMSSYKVSQALNLKASQDSLYDPIGDDTKKTIETEKSEKADSISRLDPTDPEFRQLIKDLNLSNARLAALAVNLRSQRSTSIRFYNESFTIIGEDTIQDRKSDSYRSYLDSKSKERAINQQMSILNKDINSYKAEIQNRRMSWKAQYQNERDSAARKASAIAQEMDMEKSTMDSTQKQFDSTLNKVEQSFVVRFDVLTYLAKKKKPDGPREFASIFFLLWLIRILFFVIEILPTIVKIATPFGAYDMAIYDAEENFKNIKLPAARKLLEEKVARDHEMEKAEKERQLSKRLQKEGELHDKILEDVSSTQDQIAKKILEDWKSKHLKNSGIS
jgi:hypothetical protein